MDIHLKNIERKGCIVGLVFVAVGFWLNGLHGAVSAAGGVLLALGSFAFWIFAGKRLLSGANKGKNTIIFVCLAKMGILGLLLWFAVVKFSLEPLAFLLGLSSIVTAIFIEAIFGALKRKSS